MATARRSLVVRALLLLVPAVALAEPPTPFVTKAFMRQIAAGKIRAADLVDPTAGVLELVYTSSETEPPVTKTARRLCGDDAVRAVQRAREQLKRAISFDDTFWCMNRPRPTCIAGVAGEFETTTEYTFRPAPDGTLRLDTITTTNSANRPADEPRVLARMRAKHFGGTCP